MADLGTILIILKGVTVATTTICRAVDKALELEHGEQWALRDLSRAVESLQSDTAVYETLLNAMENDTNWDTNGVSPYTRFIQRWVTGL